MEAEMRSLKPKNEQQLFIRESNEPRETIRIEGIKGTTTRVQVEVQVRFIGFETSDMNCAYQYPHPAHPQNVMAMVPTTSQQNHVPSTDTEYLEEADEGVPQFARHFAISTSKEHAREFVRGPSPD
ncbi:hypothetical protein HZH66_007220 [Vespula vulgaris]|uniref:Uncharacterized protein n=1 Tax=Vespula vulgaris TaxID=7454 RepID=A0A834JXI1_VESVU|nr:hypothetical protein HZH66_007220 [Vespula vulgaris]